MAVTTRSSSRRTKRIVQRASNASDDPCLEKNKRSKSTSRSRITAKRCSSTSSDSGSSKKKYNKRDNRSEVKVNMLPRTRENELSMECDDGAVKYVFGVDEAGRGPLAGPVVASACWLRSDVMLEGIVDSKKITSEERREELYERIVNLSSDQVRWAVTMVSPKRIDDVNILQATLQGMRKSSQMIVESFTNGTSGEENEKKFSEPFNVEEQLATGNSYYDEFGCFFQGNTLQLKTDDPDVKIICHALIDGNRVPQDMPCPSESMVKGDGREYCIAAASILAKVSRDRIMRAYAKHFPEYNFAQHKGYPTKAHKEAVTKYGASTIHRKSFAPLRDMNSD